MTLIQKPYLAGALANSLYASHKALTFDGLTDWMAVLIGLGADTFIIHRSDEASVGTWIKSTKSDTSTEQVIINRWFPHQSFPINEGGWRIYLWDVPAGATPAVSRACVFHLCTHFLEGIWICSQSSFPLNSYVNVLMTYDGSGSASGLKMYWDGQLQSTYTIYDNWTTEAVNSGPYSHLLWGTQYTAWFPGGGMPDWPPVLHYHFEGILDETTLWRFELSAAEAAILAHQGKPQSAMHVGLPNGKNVDTHFRMGEWRDSLPFLGLGISVCFGQYPVTGTPRNALWNNDGVLPSLRVTEDVPA